MIALSTSWNAWKYFRAQDLIKEIKDLGFDHVELNFSLSASMVEELISLKKAGLVKVVSVHNFCPIPEGTTRKMASPDIFSLSSRNERERQKAIRYTKNTINTAVRIGAGVVILHLGRVKMKERTKQLMGLYQAEGKQKYEYLKAQLLNQRRTRAKKIFPQTLRSLEQLSDYAQECKVKLAIENRYYFSEIPSVEEMGIILATFVDQLYYWHDVGHAQVYENLGFFKHKQMLDKFSHRMLGVHLHDIEGVDDHRAPLKGKFDFKLLKTYIAPNTLKVLEPHYPATAEEIIKGKQYLEKLLS